MAFATLVDARDLERWASSRRAQEQLPAVVRRLIHATTTTATHVGLPAGDAVQQGGYDGVVVIAEAHPEIPSGTSIWEFGVSTNPKGKADEEYEKRKAQQPDSAVGPVDPASTVFVFVTPRRWNAKTKWLKERRAESFWRDVRVLDADDLEAWLERAPATHVWLSTVLGRRPTGADDLGTVWQDWSESTAPALSPTLMFAGREPTRDKIREWFAAPPPVPDLGVESESPEEAIALVAAALVSLPESERIPLLARTVVVRDVDALVHIASADEPMAIVTTFSPGDLVQRATRGGHRVIIPRTPGEGVTNTLKIPRLNRYAAEAELVAMGLPEDRSRDLAGIARRSLMALRRRLAISAAVGRPSWAGPETGQSVLPIFFLGAVNGDVAGDVEALALLSGEPAEAAIARLVRLAAEADPPVRRVGSVWYVVSKEDAWDALSRYITRELMQRFVTLVTGILGAPDPDYELPPDQRWAAGLFEKKRAHSRLLVTGVADTLALLGARGTEPMASVGAKAADYATRAVRELFEHAGRDWQLWATLAPVFPSLMEAAPDAMLAAIESGLAGEEPSPVAGLFGHDVDGFSSSPHTHLLWALERASWSPDYFGRAARILAELARRDPGGRLANRPIASLRSIFLPWLPATAASVETRLTTLDTLRRYEPDAAWSLMAAVLPKWHDSSMRLHPPDWREWAPDRETNITHRMIAEHANEIVTRMLEDAGTSGERWTTLIEALDDVPAEGHEAILSGLASLAQRPLPEEARSEIWNALRQLLSRHRSFADADWALPQERIESIAAVFAQFEPVNIIDRHAYLFSHHSELPEGREQDYEAHRQLVASRRVSAARTWYEALGAIKMVRLSTTLDRADALGGALAESGVVSHDEEHELLAKALGHSVIAARVFGRSYLGRRFDGNGASVLAFLRERGVGWTPTIRAEGLLSVRPGVEVWAAAESLGDEGCSHYWRNVDVYWIDPVELPRALRLLVRHGRPHAALDLAAMHARREPKPLADDVRYVLLKAASVASDVTGIRSQSHSVSELVSLLKEEADAGRIAEEEIAKLELLYLPLLRHDHRPRLLHKALGQDPSFFVEAVCLAYRGEGEPEGELDDPARERALLAYELLASWRTPPGLLNGVIDVDLLNAWLSEARRQLAERNRATIGDQLIGQVLSGSPPGDDGVWPAEPVREAIEEMKSEELEVGLSIGRFNQRGVVTRNPLSGGDMERSIKAQYEADASKLAARWPRTAALLRSLAATYERDAAREDFEAELRQDLSD